MSKLRMTVFSAFERPFVDALSLNHEEIQAFTARDDNPAWLGYEPGMKSYPFI